MRGIFDINSKFMQTLTAVGDYILLNLCFVLLCVPIVTIGAARTALYRAMFDLIEDRGGIYKTLFVTWWREIKNTLPTMLFKTVLFGFLVWEMWFVLNNPVPFAHAAAVGLLVMLCVAASLTSSIYPQIARFSATTKQYWKNAVYIALTHPIQALFMGVTDILPLVLFFGAPKYFTMIGPIWPFLYFSVVTMFGARMMRKPFAFYIEQTDQKDEKG